MNLFRETSRPLFVTQRHISSPHGARAVCVESSLEVWIGQVVF